MGINIKKENLQRCIPIVTIEKFEDTEKIISSLYKFGISNAEITLRTDCSIKALEYATKNFPNMNIGAGTVINKKQVKQALRAGARFIVSPGFSKEIAKYCIKKGVTYYPGCVTPTEIMQAISFGITTIKYFPAKIYGGLEAMKALAGPFPQIKFIPTCGITEENVNEFLEWEKTYAVGGSLFIKLALDS